MTHPESVALFDVFARQLELSRLWFYQKPGSTAGLEVWEVTRVDQVNKAIQG